LPNTPMNNDTPVNLPAQPRPEPARTAPFLFTSENLTKLVLGLVAKCEPEAVFRAVYDAVAGAASVAWIEYVINASRDLMEGDLKQELANWRHDFLTARRGRLNIHGLHEFMDIEDSFLKKVPGPDAFRRITGSQELAGEEGAVELYRQFLIDYRLRRPEICGEKEWLVIVSAFATYLITEVMADGMPGDRCFLDCRAYPEWKNPPQFSLKRGKLNMQWVPRSPHIGASRGGKCSTARRITKKDDMSLSGGGRNKWTKEQREAGIPKAYYASNARNNREISNALAANRVRTNNGQIKAARGGLLGEEPFVELDARAETAAKSALRKRNPMRKLWEWLQSRDSAGNQKPKGVPPNEEPPDEKEPNKLKVTKENPNWGKNNE
jgi:hypothetical protein